MAKTMTLLRGFAESRHNSLKDPYGAWLVQFRYVEGARVQKRAPSGAFFVRAGEASKSLCLREESRKGCLVF